MIIHTHRVNYNYGDVIKIKPIGDVHFGNKYCDKKNFKEFLADSDDDTYFLGIGDLLDSIITKDIKRYEKHSDDSVSDAVIDEQVNGMSEILMPYRDKIIGLGRGNHESTIRKYCGTDPMARLCEKLECTYLGYSGLIKLILSENGTRSRTVIIRWHHGWGGGSRTQGADLTKYSKDTMHWDADIFLYGHVHRKQSDSVPRIGLAGTKIISKPKLIGICGTFLKTYSDTIESTYSEEKGYPPVEIGGIKVNIKPREHWVKSWIDI
jgi:predicted phosphodiesterase